MWFQQNHHFINFTIQLGTSTITPSKTARNLGVVIDDQLNYYTTLLKLPGPADLLYPTLGRSGPFFWNMLHNSLFKLLFCPDSRLDYCNALLAGIPASSIKPLQLIQNAAARLIFNEPKITHFTPLFINLHWLPIAAHIKFKALMFAYKTTTGSAPLFLNSLLQMYVPLEACVLQVNGALLCHPKEAQSHFH